MDQQLLDKIEAYRAKGFEVPDADMIKTRSKSKAFVKLRNHTKVLSKLLPYHCMTTADIDKIVYDFTTAQCSSCHRFAFSVFALPSMTKFATAFPVKMTCSKVVTS